MNKTDYKDMWVFIERDGDSVLPVSLELCSETRKLCDASGEKLVAVIVGSISDGELQRVLDCGVDKVIHVTGTGYDYFNNDAYTNLFTFLCRKYRPSGGHGRRHDQRARLCAALRRAPRHRLHFGRDRAGILGSARRRTSSSLSLPSAAR